MDELFETDKPLKGYTIDVMRLSIKFNRSKNLPKEGTGASSRFFFPNRSRPVIE